MSGPASLDPPSARSTRDYILRERIGRGGSGEVWKAEGPGGFEVALKFVPLDGRPGRREVRALEILRTIRHPNLLVAFGAWVVDDLLVLVMELADGTLLDRFASARAGDLPGIPRAELLGYLADAATGLDYLNDYRHEYRGRASIGIQHGDIKPQNLLLVGGGVKIADLGLARPLGASVEDRMRSWSFAYAAPEFFRNRDHALVRSVFARGDLLLPPNGTAAVLRLAGERDPGPDRGPPQSRRLARGGAADRRAGAFQGARRSLDQLRGVRRGSPGLPPHDGGRPDLSRGPGPARPIRAATTSCSGWTRTRLCSRSRQGTAKTHPGRIRCPGRWTSCG